MPYTALFSLLCAGALTTQPPQIESMPAVVHQTSFTAALSGCYMTPFQSNETEPTKTATPTYGPDAVEAAELQDDSVEATDAVSAKPPQVVLEHSNIPAELLDTSQPIDRVAAMISSNEGKMTTIDWNDNGKGVSIGIFQANQQVGELPDLLHEFATTPEGEQTITETLGPTVYEQLTTDPEQIRTMRISPKNALGQGFKKLVHSRPFQELQVAILRRKVAKAADLAANYGLTSTAGVAVCADLTNQWGEGRAKRFLEAADSMRSQGGKVKAVVNAVCDYSPYDSRYQGDLLKIAANDLSYSDTFYVIDKQQLD